MLTYHKCRTCMLSAVVSQWFQQVSFNNQICSFVSLLQCAYDGVDNRREKEGEKHPLQLDASSAV